MDEQMKKFFEPWELKVLELIEESKKLKQELEKGKNVVEKVADKDTNTDKTKS